MPPSRGYAMKGSRFRLPDHCSDAMARCRQTISLREARYLLGAVCGVIAFYTVCLTLVLTIKNQNSLIPSNKLNYNMPIEQNHLVVPKVNLTGPTTNPIPSLVQWQEDLSWEPPLCNASHPFILAVVPSAVGNFEARQRVRNTWANSKYYTHTGIRTVFVLGSTVNQTLQQQVGREINLHHDIIQNTFIDSYRNLTYKSISWLSWVRDWCPDPTYVAKIDDDVVVDPFYLYNLLSMKLKLGPPVPRVIYGQLRRHVTPHKRGRWRVGKEEYAGMYYPMFVLGPAYIVGREAVDDLLRYTSYVPHLWLEDVYITGLVAEAAGVQRVSATTVYWSDLQKRKGKRKWLAIFYLDMDADNMDDTWKGIIGNSSCCKHL